MLIKVVAIQSVLGQELSLEEKLFIFRHNPDFICLPEYCLIDQSMSNFSRAALQIQSHLEYLKSLSDNLSTCLIGGSVVEADSEALYNTAYLFDRGKIIGRYRKLNPVDGELEKGILPGDNILVAEVNNVRICVIICADALNPGLFEEIGRHNVDITFIPTTSPHRPEEKRSTKFKRDHDIYVHGAQLASCFIVKTCGVGKLFGKTLQGRTLFASPWGVLKRVEPESELTSMVLSIVFDIDEIRDFRGKRRGA